MTGVRLMRGLAAVTTTLAVLAAAPPSARAQAQAQGYPTQTITIVLPFSAGTGIDTATRVFAEKLSQRLGQPVILENRPGAGGNLGHAAAAKAAPDGYTLLMAANTLAMNTSLYNLPFDPATSFAPVGLYVKGGMALIVHQKVKAGSVADLVALAKDSPGKLNYATPGIGTPQHLAMELLKRTTGADIVHIPHKGAAEAVREVVRGELETMFVPVQSILPHIKEGTVRALAVSGTKRHPALPETPTIAEATGDPDFDVDLWYGLFAPAGTPQQVMDKLNSEIRAIVELTDVQERLQKLGMSRNPSSARELGDLYRNDAARWAKLIREANIKPQ
jgi:tripartite-type tricarboxylate transporter receptor subunit TctC